MKHDASTFTDREREIYQQGFNYGQQFAGKTITIFLAVVVAGIILIPYIFKYFKES